MQQKRRAIAMEIWTPLCYCISRDSQSDLARTKQKTTTARILWGAVVKGANMKCTSWAKGKALDDAEKKIENRWYAPSPCPPLCGHECMLSEPFLPFFLSDGEYPTEHWAKRVLWLGEIGGISAYPRRCKTTCSSVGQSAGLSIPRTTVHFRQNHPPQKKRG